MRTNWRFAWWVPLNLFACALAATASLFVIAAALTAVKVGKIGFAHSLLWVWLGLTLIAMLPAAIRDAVGIWRFFARKDQTAFSREPGWRDLLWRVGLGSALGPVVLIFMEPR